MSLVASKETAQARAGEELDAGRLREHLSTHFRTSIRELSIEQFPFGSSNLTYLISMDGQEYVLRRPPFGNTIRTAHDMRREFKVLSKISNVYTPAPRPVHFCDDAAVIGSDFFLLERRRGLIIRGRSPEVLERSASLQTSVCESFIRNLADLHSIDIRANGLDDLGHPDGYCRRQVEGWSKRYLSAKTQHLPALDAVIVWLHDNLPRESGAALVHNDYKFDNIILDPDHLTVITGVLDWEMAAIGDPLMDLGTSLGYWMGRSAGDEMLSMPFNPRVLMENIGRDELVEMYAAASGRDVSNILFYYVFGTLKIAVIAQQIYARYAKGFTGDARFARFDRLVAALGKIARHAIDTNQI